MNITNQFQISTEDETPFIQMNLEKVKSNLDFFQKTLSFSSDEIFYPVKVNLQKEIVELLNDSNCNFEVGAVSEVEELKSMGIKASQIIFGNPIKQASHIKRAYYLGIRTFGADTENELRKISKNAPGSDVYFRIDIDNTGAEWALKGKFGTNIDNLPSLFEFSKSVGLNPLGFSFHLGWNNANEATWKMVFEQLDKKIIELQKKNVDLKTINIGGGFPAHLNNQYADLEKIADVILPYLKSWREKNIKVLAEPGSFLVANAGVLVTSVIEKVERNGKTWIFVDSGIFQGFYWILGGLKYQIESLEKSKSENFKKMIVCGPTCDTHDIFSEDILLPTDIKTGDKLIIHPAGAYISSAQKYNGFDYPKQIID
ncbi:MAG: hypothetical protein RBS19_03975 [Bacteroidales bacterium]|nr:hypothetical protein [Bacteroidales bacterium]MDY0216099.1 hypothetical protein [Bacteroidales bacterium]